MSDTVEQSVGMAGAPPGGPAGAPSPLLRGLRVFARQREATVFVVAVALFLYFAIDQGSTFTSKANLVTLFSDDAWIEEQKPGQLVVLIRGSKAKGEEEEEEPQPENCS